MERTYIANLPADQVSRASGFVDTIRQMKWGAFVVLRDTTGKIQVTVDKATIPEIVTVTPHSVLSVVGTVKENPSVRLGGREMMAESITIESLAEALPIQNDSEIEARMDYRWIDLRREENQLMIKVQTTLVSALREFLLEKKFVEIHTPKLIGAASESGSDVFEVKYFDTNAYLAQSPQFYKQMAMAAGLERIFETGPVFRAEKSYTNKHATEFSGFDLEFSYIDSMYDVMKMEEELLTYALAKVKEAHGDEIVRLYGEEYAVNVPTTPFPIIKLKDLYKELEERYGYSVPESMHGDLTTDAERLCARFAKEKYNHEFLFVIDYDAKERAFYHMRDENGVPQGYDLIWRGVEITTGAQREHRYEVLKAQAEEKGLAQDVEFYLRFFRYGCPPHGGFGLGIDRLTMLFLGLSIKEVQFLFRGPNRLTP
ncbi:MAG: aspartate--tRNA(Asn) ligase [Clostridia bacterium]|nr:aspartate--tRNA(Asn) ligase [Clostridia bacterium]